MISIGSCLSSRTNAPTLRPIANSNNSRHKSGWFVNTLQNTKSSTNVNFSYVFITYTSNLHHLRCTVSFRFIHEKRYDYHSMLYSLLQEISPKKSKRNHISVLAPACYTMSDIRLRNDSTISSASFTVFSSIPSERSVSAKSPRCKRLIAVDKFSTPKDCPCRIPSSFIP